MQATSFYCTAAVSGLLRAVGNVVSEWMNVS